METRRHGGGVHRACQANRSTAPILCDGAVELRDGAESLKNQRFDVIVLNDFKHKAANYFKAMLRKDQRFAEFTTQLGRTRCAIQQTELGHLVPRSLKEKVRFMNLGPVLEWASAVLWLLDHPEAKAHRNNAGTFGREARLAPFVQQRYPPLAGVSTSDQSRPQVYQ